MASLDGKAVVVTGAGRGLGEAYAWQLCRAGAMVVVNDVDAEAATRTADEIRTGGFPAIASTHSVTDPEAAQAIVDLCVDRFGRIDGLVNNAGLIYESLPWDDDPQQARELIEVNVLGTIYTGLAALRAMKDRGSGSIVNISSGASIGQRTLGAYSASKGAVASLTYSWALDLESAGIRVNAVCPVAYTRMSWSSERVRAKVFPEHSPDRVAPLIVFLLSDDSAGITGQMIRCNGPQLHLIGQPYFKAPILERDTWDTDTVDRAFTEVFQAHLEPYGMEKRLPPRLRDWLTPATA